MKTFTKYAADYFEEMSQVLFFRNAYFGMFFIALSVFFEPRLFLCGFLSSLLCYSHSHLYRTPKIIKYCGLITINGFFFGIAMATLFQDSIQLYTCLMVGTFAIPLITKAAFEVLQHWKLSPFIIPYILITWVFYLSSHTIALSFQTNTAVFENFAFLPDFNMHTSILAQIVLSTFMSIGRIFFLPDPNFGLAVFVLISAFSFRNGIYLLGGASLATLASFLLSAGAIANGDFGQLSYSAGLVALGLASLQEKYSFRTIALFCLLSLFLTMAMATFLGHLQLPILSLPYVLSFWIAMLSRVPRLNVNWTPSVTG